MRYGIISDVHANLPALASVLSRCRELQVDAWICAGDVVGYGPHPAECLAEIEALRPCWVLGNHELMLLGRLSPDTASPVARAAIEWTRSVLPAGAISALGDLPLIATLPDGIVVTHGSLADPSLRIAHRAAAENELARFADAHPGARVLVLGHTHRPMLAHERDSLAATASSMASFSGQLGVRRRLQLTPTRRYLLNPGSVGQARGFSRRARAAVLDISADTLELLAVPYDTTSLRRDLASAGLPVWSHHRSPLRRFAERAQRKAARVLRHRPQNAAESTR